MVPPALSPLELDELDPEGNAAPVVEEALDDDVGLLVCEFEIVEVR
jgi:hypothetical protein